MIYKACLLLLAISPGFVQAQRGHEISFQAGVFINNGSNFFNYFEKEDIRHSFELDQNYSATFYVGGWEYPVSSNLSLGAFVRASLESKMVLRETESAVFTSEGRALRPDTLFTGTTSFDSDVLEVGVNARFSLLRFNRFKWYLNSQIGINFLKTITDDETIVQASDPGLRQAIFDTYAQRENWIEIGLGTGLAYSLKNGFNLRIIEIYGKKPVTPPQSYSSTLSNLEFRTGISYQFYRSR